jgi:hypothetical protein
MSKSSIVMGGFVGLSIVLAGCSGADDGTSTGGSLSNQTGKTPVKTPDKTGDTTSTADPTTPGPDSAAVECVAPGAKGNALGIGAYCQAATECKSGTFCTAGLAPKGAEFCTAFCTSDTDCGEGASCYSDPRGKACAPTACIASMSK